MDLIWLEKLKWEGTEVVANKFARIMFDEQGAYPPSNRETGGMSEKEMVRRRLPKNSFNVEPLGQEIVLKITKEKDHHLCEECCPDCWG